MDLEENNLAKICLKFCGLYNIFFHEIYILGKFAGHSSYFKDDNQGNPDLKTFVNIEFKTIVTIYSLRCRN